MAENISFVDEEDIDQYIIENLLNFDMEYTQNEADTSPIATKSIIDLKNYIDSKKSVNTVKKTTSVITKFATYLKENNEERRVLDIPAPDLDVYIGSYLLTLRKKDGSPFEPDTLTSYHRAIDRYLRDNDYPHNIIKSDIFKTSRRVLEARRKELKQQGKGNRPNKSDSLSSEDEDRLWNAREFGSHSPAAMINTLWYFFTKMFGLRGRDESRQLRWGDVHLKTDSNGFENLEFWERSTKTRDGNSAHSRMFNPKIFAATGNSDRCIVTIYKAFRVQRPPGMMLNDAPFYLAINHRRKYDGPWFQNMALGVNTLGSLMKGMAERSGLVGKITNHSARKSMCTQLLHAGVEPTTICQLSGHKNVNSLNNYAVASIPMQKQMCDILSEGQSKSLVPVTNSTVKKRKSCDSVPSHKNDVSAATCASDIVSRGQSMTSGLFSGSNIHGGSFHINFNFSSQTNSMNVPPKRRRAIIDSDSDSE